MSIPNSEEGLANVLRLSGLKHARGRRVKPNIYSLPEEYPEVEGRSSIPNSEPSQENIPQVDMGGSLDSQGYDVRANSVIPQAQPEDEPGGLRKLGRFLGNLVSPNSSYGVKEETVRGAQQKAAPSQGGIFSTQNWTPDYPGKTVAQTPPIETEQVDMQEGIPAVTASQEAYPPQQSSSFFGNMGKALTDYVEPFKKEGHYYGEPTPENARLIEDAQLRTQGHVPDEYRAEQEKIKKNTQETVMDKIDKSLENPTETAVYGATDIVANQPDLKAQFDKILGTDFNEEISKQTSEYEKVLDDIENQINLEGNGYNEQEQRIKERILSNQATDMDKYFVGLAVLMPLIVGAFFGKEAALGALGGGAKGVSEIFGQRNKQNMENEKLLADISQNKGQNQLKKSELDLKRLELPAKIQKNLPKQENEHLIGKNLVRWKDPSTGEDREGVELKPGLIARPEFIKDKEELKEMRKEAQEISSAIVPLKEINDLTSDIIDIAGRLKDKNIISQAFSAYISGRNPGLATKLGETIEYKGRKVNSYVILEHKIKLLTDAYRQVKGMRALTNTVQEHIEGLFRNPAASFQSYEDTKDQMLYTRDLAQSRFLNTAEGAGFVPEFLIETLKPQVKDVYNKLNTREGEKEAAELLRD